jgi:glycosyltransferase involved in cell wall biosynthesis
MLREFSRKSKLVGAILGKLVELLEDKYITLWDGVIVTDHSLYGRFAKYRNDIRLIHLFPQLSVFKNTPGFGLPEPPYRLVYIGQLRMERGIFQAAEAVKILNDRRIPVRMDFIGIFSYARERKKMEKWIAENDLCEVISIIDYIPHYEVPQILSNYHIGLVTLLPLQKFKKNEPTKLFEYMAAGLAVVGSNFPPISFYVKKYHVGLICDPTSPWSIAHTIEKLISDPQIIMRYGMNGRSAVEQDANWESQVDEFLNVFPG